jgi:predicted O-methyltransferase YrrM
MFKGVAEPSLFTRVRASLDYRSRRLLDALRRRLLPLVFPPSKGRRWIGPIDTIHSEWTAIFDPAEDASGPSDELVRLAVAAAEIARTTNLDALSERASRERERTELPTWPGQHYRLLVGLAEAWQARAVVEVGTYAGSSALSFLLAAHVERVTTFDVVPWSAFPFTLLTESDFTGNLEQRLGDLADPATFEANAELLRDADMVFIDGPKDTVFEYEFIPRLLALAPRRPRLLVLDDVRVISMMGLWRQFPLSKLDIGSLGHWSGTGIAIQHEGCEWRPQTW